MRVILDTNIRIRPHNAGRLINELKALAVLVDPLPYIKRSPDPDDDFLLAAAEACKAHYLVIGDKVGLLSSVKHRLNTKEPELFLRPIL